MKKVIIIVSVLVCAILAFGIVCAAEGETPELKIVGGNLSFEDSVALVYAVNAVGVNADDVRMLYWTAPATGEDAYTKGTEAYWSFPIADEVVDEKDCKVFKYDNIFAKEMTDYIYARAYIKVDGVEYYSQVIKYSVLQYAYNMLGYTAEGSTDPELHDVLQNMLLYGASAQKYKNYREDNLATDTYSKIVLNGATFADGFPYELIKVGNKVTLYAITENADDYVVWKDSEGKSIATGNTLEITVPDVNTKYTAECTPAALGHKVTFVDYNGDILKEENVKSGESATAPTDPSRKGYNFTGWDVPYNNVTSDLTVTAQYEIVDDQICIEYVDNGDGTTTAKFSINGNVNIAMLELIMSFELNNAEYESVAIFVNGADTNYVDGEFLFSLMSANDITTDTELFSITFATGESDVSIVFTILDSIVSDPTYSDIKSPEIVGLTYSK